MHTFSETQINRLAVLGAEPGEYGGLTFGTADERNQAYQKIEKQAAAANKDALTDLLNNRHEPKTARMIRSIKTALYAARFTEMQTPAIIPKIYLEHMSVTDEHPLNSQVFWLGSKSCLRPMLAPGLYAVSQKLLNISELPLRLFEIGSCFRKESEGKIHLKEFTMLNIVEWGTPEDKRDERIKELSRIVLDAAGISGYAFQTENSTVYGDGLDVTDRNGMELASSSKGPHPLDAAWKITCSWTGIGFGIERLVTSKENADGVHRYARSFAYADGAALDVK